MEIIKDIFIPKYKRSNSVHIVDSTGVTVFNVIENSVAADYLVATLNSEPYTEKQLEYENKLKERGCVWVIDNNFYIALDDNGQKRKLFMIRGWGHMTGTGVTALHLSAKDAIQIQQEFLRYTIDKLNERLHSEH